MAKLRETKTTNSKKTVGLRRNPKRITSEKSLQSLDDSFSKETINPQVKNDTPQDKVVVTSLRKRKLETTPEQPNRVQKNGTTSELDSEASIGFRKSKRVRNIGLSTVLQPIPNAPKTRQAAKTSQTNENHREVDRVENLRKRKDRLEFLVKWKNSDDEEWIAKDIIINEHPQSVIAFFQTIIRFK